MENFLLNFIQTEVQAWSTDIFFQRSKVTNSCYSGTRDDAQAERVRDAEQHHRACLAKVEETTSCCYPAESLPRISFFHVSRILFDSRICICMPICAYVLQAAKAKSRETHQYREKAAVSLWRCDNCSPCLHNSRCNPCCGMQKWLGPQTS